MSKVLPWLGLSALLALPDAHAQRAPQPAKQLDVLAPLLGNWRCQGRLLAQGTLAERKTKGWLRVRLDLDKHFVAGRYEGRSTEPMLTMRSQYFIGWDGQRYVNLTLDNLGSTGQAHSAGWAGDAMVWSGETRLLGGQRYLRRTTVTRKGPRELSMTSDVRRATSDPWTKVAEELCRK